MQLSLELILIASLSLLSFILATVVLLSHLSLKKHYDRLTHGVEPKHLIKALEGIQKTLSTHERNYTLLHKQQDVLMTKTKSHLQTISLKRFNPFSDTGGDQSFILALLDGNSDGVVITSLHSRENTRFYVKSVKGGVGVDHPLSSDEQKIIKR